MDEPQKNDKVLCKVENCVIPVDVVLQSRDGERLGAHAKNLECFNEGFPPEGWAQKLDEVVVLTESSAVLSLLLNFMHNTAFPDLEDERISVDDLLLLCEASEKYGNFIALQASRKALKARVKNMHSGAVLKVLRYKVCRGDTTDIDIFARRTPDIPIKEMWSFCKGYPEVYYIWSRYQIAWTEWDSVFESAMVSSNFEANHRDTSYCPYLEKYLTYLRDSKKDGGVYTTWETFTNHRAILKRVPELRTFCGCGAFSAWLLFIEAVFERQPRWENYAGIEEIDF